MVKVSDVAWGLFPVFFKDNVRVTVTARNLEDALKEAVRLYPVYDLGDVKTVMLSSYTFDEHMKDWVDINAGRYPVIFTLDAG